MSYQLQLLDAPMPCLLWMACCCLLSHPHQLPQYWIQLSWCGGGSVEAVGSLEESRLENCLQLLIIRQRVVWQLIFVGAVGPLAEGSCGGSDEAVGSLEESWMAN